MLKQFLNSSSLTSMIVRDKEDGSGSGTPEKTPVQLAREAIAANTVVANAPAKKTEDEAVVDEEDDEDENEEEVKADDSEEDDEDKNEDETAEEKELRLANEEKEKIAKSKDERAKERVQKRIDKAVAAQKVAEQRAEELQAKLDAKPDAEKVLTAEDVERLANEKAVVLQAEKEFIDMCDKLHDSAVKLDKDFEKNVNQMAKEYGPIPRSIIHVLDELPNGSEILSLIAKDEDLAEDIYKVSNKSEKLALKLVRLSDKMIADAKKPTKQISKVPAPADTITGNGRVQTNTITGKESTEDYIAKRRRQMEEARTRR